MFFGFFPADLAPFAQIPFWEIVFVVFSQYLGFFIRGAFGFGSNMPIVLLTTWVLGPHHAILLVVLTSFIAQAHLLPQGFHSADWEVTRPLMLGLLGGIAFGTWIFAILAANWLTLVMGVLISVIVMMDYFRLLERLSNWINLRSHAVTSSLAVTSGAVGTVSGGGGLYFLVAYLKLACATPKALRGTNLILSGVFIIGRVISLSLAGLMTWQFVVEALLLVPAVFLGTWTGTRFFHASSPERFYGALQFVLFCAAIALVGKGVAQFL